jgi:hypothetical protein
MRMERRGGDEARGKDEQMRISATFKTRVALAVSGCKKLYCAAVALVVSLRANEYNQDIFLLALALRSVSLTGRVSVYHGEGVSLTLSTKVQLGFEKFKPEPEFKPGFGLKLEHSECYSCNSAFPSSIGCV